MSAASLSARLRFAAAAVLMALACVACGPNKIVAAPAERVAEREAPQAARVVSGQGVVVSVELSRSLLYMQQAPVAEMGWPAMTIGYAASTSALEGLKAGDRIAFELELGGGGYLLSTRRL